jgi:hypothetical protein
MLEMVMEVGVAMAPALNHKTTILLDKPLHKRLRQVAKERGTSIGELVRQACVEKYAQPTVAERMAALERILALDDPLPTPDTFAELKAQYVEPYKPIPGIDDIDEDAAA